MGDALLVVHCAEGGRKALGSMVEHGHRLPTGLRTFELPCLGRINETMLMEALQEGVDGIIVVGCRKDNCRYLDGNLRAEKCVGRVTTLLHDAGIAKKFVEMLWTAPDEGQRLYENLRSFSEKLKQETVVEEQT